MINYRIATIPRPRPHFDIYGLCDVFRHGSWRNTTSDVSRTSFNHVDLTRSLLLLLASPPPTSRQTNIDSCSNNPARSRASVDVATNTNYLRSYFPVSEGNGNIQQRKGQLQAGSDRATDEAAGMLSPFQLTTPILLPCCVGGRVFMHYDLRSGIGSVMTAPVRRNAIPAMTNSHTASSATSPPTRNSCTPPESGSRWSTHSPPCGSNQTITSPRIWHRAAWTIECATLLASHNSSVSIVVTL